MATGVASWSQTAANNATADSTINWQEGQAPSSINDSARAVMAAVAKYRDDISGKIVTAGTSSAYTVTSNQGFASLTALDSAMIAFVPHTDSASAPTLSVDGLTSKPLRGWTGTDLLTGVLKAGTPYIAFYNNSNGEFVLHSYAVNPSEIPIGGGIDYWGTTVPSDNFVFPYGQAISRTTYATCYARLGTAYGSGDGTTTFNLPDKRGRVGAGKGDMGGTDVGLLSSSVSGVDGKTLGATGGVQGRTINKSNLPNVSFTFTGTPGTVTTVTDNATILAAASISPGTSLQAGSSFSVDVIGAGSLSKGARGATGTFTPSGTVSSGGSDAVFPTTQPTIICNYIIRIK